MPKDEQFIEMSFGEIRQREMVFNKADQ